MARGKETPEEMVAESQRQRMKLAVERAEAERDLLAAYVALQIPSAARTPRAEAQSTLQQRARLLSMCVGRVAEEAAALGREGESLDDIAAAEAEAHRAIAINTRRIAALAGAMDQLKAEIGQLEEQHIEWFARRAHELSLAAVAGYERARAGARRRTHGATGGSGRMVGCRGVPPAARLARAPRNSGRRHGRGDEQPRRVRPVGAVAEGVRPTTESELAA